MFANAEIIIFDCLNCVLTEASVIELKRGGFKIEIDEVIQAENYVRQIRKSGALHDTATIHAFVVGASIGDVDRHKVTDSGVVDIVTFV
mgnify:CR=1 FL=1